MIPADWVMERVIHPDLAPLEITKDMQSLGLENTFLAGEFRLRLPALLKSYRTPANQREDVSTDPDPYNQSTPSDMGMLLEDIFQCADIRRRHLSSRLSGPDHPGRMSADD